MKEPLRANSQGLWLSMLSVTHPLFHKCSFGSILGAQGTPQTIDALLQVVDRRAWQRNVADVNRVGNELSSPVLALCSLSSTACVPLVLARGQLVAVHVAKAHQSRAATI